ncbi:MAG: hypothetical protein VKN72_06330 [Nostocales cyanobacterium 94392]|nr:hypothetical protein [Nostocales cyanobacterium 94392]
MSRYLKLLPSLLIVLAGTFTLTPSIAQTTNEEPGLRKFIERMLSVYGDTKVIVGKLPEKMPVELPIPSNSQILGSTVSEKGNIQVVLDASGTVEQVTDFYKTQLQNIGWNKPKNHHIYNYNRGFVKQTSEFGDYITFCHQTNKLLYVGLRINKGKETPSVVSVDLNPVNEKDENTYNPCETVNYMEDTVALPILTPPSDTEVSRKGIDHYNNESGVILETKLDSKTLANHYSQQLEKAGWKRIDSGESNSYSWSTWTFKDEKGKSRQGLMNFTRLEGKPNQYFANLKVL